MVKTVAIQGLRYKMTPQSKAAVYLNLSGGSVSGAPNVNSKTEALHKTTEAILNTHCPYLTSKQREDRPPWMAAAVV